MQLAYSIAVGRYLFVVVFIWGAEPVRFRSDPAVGSGSLWCKQTPKYWSFCSAQNCKLFEKKQNKILNRVFFRFVMFKVFFIFTLNF